MTAVVRPVPAPPVPAPPFSNALRVAAALCLIAAALLNGLSQALVGLVTGDLGSFDDQIAWGARHPVVHSLEQSALLLSSLVMPLGLLGVAHVCRFRTPKLTAVATLLVLWGMWGFGNVLAMGYVTGTVAPGVLGVEPSVTLNAGLAGVPGAVWLALVPHLIGSFLGLLLLGVAAWRAGFPRPAVVLLWAFLVWDFLFPPLGPVDPHWLLVVAWGWWGLHLLRMPAAVWRGAPGRGTTTGQHA